jgi:signal transduction histidine kinase
MQPDRTLLKKRTTLAGIVLGLLLTVLIIFLLRANYIALTKLHASALRQLIYDAERLAISTSYFYSERKDDLKEIAESREISMFFENEALGMSMDYGLKASLIVISKRFDRLLNEKKFDDEKVFTRILFIRNNGKLLIDCGALKNLKGNPEGNWKRYLTPDSSEPSIIPQYNGEFLEAAVSTPYFFKKQYRGQILAFVSPVPLYKNLIQSEAESSNRIYGIIYRKGKLYSATTANLMVPCNTEIDFRKVESLKPYGFKLHDKETTSDMIALKVPVKEAPFSLGVLVPSSEVSHNLSPWKLPVATGVLLMAILGAIGRLWQLDTRNKVLQAHIEEADRVEHEVREKNLQLEKEIKEREHAEEKLRQIKEELEIRVAKRTRELDVANIQLRKELAERKQAEQERKELEARFQRAKKMEAIGTLAGGVAHDLNNVLAGIVGYPDLLLRQIPEDSPLRKPVLTMKKSGEKAAAIVQDLLTLARRGVAVAEIINMNDIITDYLKTPEHEKIKSTHPQVRFKINLEENLFNIIGSPVHLSKTIMNLLANAAEAMPDGGEVIISSTNRYIDKPVRGYDHVKEGEYVTITISDEGIGMSEEDMEKIFEPFYTKKVMGRSGTGLGMTVVWGTVKDHNGYIDIQSTEGKGTTVTLYFPVTRELSKGSAPVKIEDLSGTETILVVDDVDVQREVACNMLSKLGYTVISASSGEEAVEYLRERSVDLLLLDMIMGPGIDGLETYKRILEIHPGQKSIIVSGFAETERVVEAQSIGAGAYLRKPFMLESLGMAVRNELDG